MGYLCVILEKAMHRAEGMLTRRYSRKNGQGGFFFNSLICLFAMVFALLTNPGELYFPKGVFVYGIITSLMVAAGYYSMYRALQLGSFMLTTMIMGFYSVIVLLYALLYLRESANIMRYAAIILSVISAVVVNIDEKGHDNTSFSPKWLFWTLICLISNGIIGILKREQQIAFNAQCDNEFMVLSLGGAFLLLVILALIRERNTLRQSFRSDLLYGIAIGLTSGGKGILNLISYRYLPISVSSPVGAGIALVFSFIISVFIYKEKFTKFQLVGTLLGVIAALLIALE